jgi:hypothetical protein
MDAPFGASIFLQDFADPASRELRSLRVPLHGYVLPSAVLTTFVFASRLASISALPYTFIVVEIWAVQISGPSLYQYTKISWHQDISTATHHVRRIRQKDHRTASQRSQEGNQLLLLRGTQVSKALSGVVCFTIVTLDCVVERQRPQVVHEAGLGAQTPERRSS